MAWRVLEHADSIWKVTCAAERPPHAEAWRLVLSFRSAERHRRAFWAAYPLEADSKAALFHQADRLSDEALAAVLTERLR